MERVERKLGDVLRAYAETCRKARNLERGTATMALVEAYHAQATAAQAIVDFGNDGADEYIPLEAREPIRNEYRRMVRIHTTQRTATLRKVCPHHPYLALLDKAMDLDLPKHYENDLRLHDFNAVMHQGRGLDGDTYFWWAIGECGTHFGTDFSGMATVHRVYGDNLRYFRYRRGELRETRVG